MPTSRTGTGGSSDGGASWSTSPPRSWRRPTAAAASSSTSGAGPWPTPDVLNALPERSRFYAGLRSWVGGRQDFVSYERCSREHGRSRVGLLGLVALAETALISFSKVPLRA